MSTYKLSDTILRRVYPLVKDNAKLRAEGITKDRLRTIIRDNRAVKLARGQYISAHNWQNLNITEKHLARIIAYSRVLDEPVFTHQSAAILHGFPVLEVPVSVHVYSQSGSSNEALTRHNDSYARDASITRFLAGITATSPIETVVGCARVLQVDEAVVVADGALSRQQTETRINYWELHHALMNSPRKGSARVREVARLMSDKSDSPGETLTRLRLQEYGLFPVEQYFVKTDLGNFVSDFAFEQLGVLIEFDGRVKQTDKTMNPDGWVVDREKERENALMRAGWRLLRLRWEHVRGRGSPWVLESALRSFGIL